MNDSHDIIPFCTACGSAQTCLSCGELYPHSQNDCQATRTAKLAADPADPTVALPAGAELLASDEQLDGRIDYLQRSGTISSTPTGPGWAELPRLVSEQSARSLTRLGVVAR